MTKRVTTQDIADAAGVSKATVSYVFNGSGSVSEKTKARILQLARELGYQENKLAKATRTGKTHTIGLVLPDLCNPFFPELAQSIVETAGQQGYTVLLVDACNDLKEEVDGINRLLAYSIEGLIWCPIEDESVKRVNIPCPVVMIDRPIEGYDSVFADSHKGGQLQASLLSRHGHRKVGLLSGPNRSPSAQMRRQGFLEALSGEIDLAWEYELEYSVDIPEIVKEQVLSSDVTCVVAANDTLAVGLLKELHKAGINVPEDISIIGFDDIHWADLVYPALTTVKLPIREIGSTAFDVLFNKIEEPKASLQARVLDVEVVNRESLLTIGH